MDDARRPPRPTVLDLYRAAWSAGRAVVRRYRLSIAVEALFVVAYVMVRTVADRPILDAWWTMAAIGLALISPTAGIVVLAAIAPFDEPLGLSRALGLKHLLVLALAVSVGIRILRRPRSFPRSVPLVAAALFGAGMLAGVALAYRRFGSVIGWETLHFWLAGAGGAMIIALVAGWLGRRRQLRPLAVSIGAGAIAGYLGLIDWLNPAVIRDSPLGWLLSAKRFDLRLTGIIASPNAVAATIVVPTAFLAVDAVLGRDVRWRIVAGLATLPLLAALWLTYSRAALLAVFAIAVVCAWRIRRTLGAVVLAAGLVAGLILAPGYLAARHEAVGGEGAIREGSILVASDQLRFRAWGATLRMAADSPVVGHGFRSFKRLGPRYGEPLLGSPHNEWLRPFAEEGVAVGLAGIGFLVTSLVILGRRRDAFFSAILAGFAGWAIMATFNNPLLFVQVNAIVFTVVGSALGLAARPARPPESAAGSAGPRAPTHSAAPSQVVAPSPEVGPPS